MTKKLGYCVNPKDFYWKAPEYVYKYEADMCPAATKTEYLGQIWSHCFKLVLDDIIDNSTTFKLPVPSDAFLEMRDVSGEDFKKARQRGAFADVDILKTNFHGYMLSYRYALKDGVRIKPLNVDKRMQHRIMTNVNNGKRYH
jgi:hypothetical protein